MNFCIFRVTSNFTVAEVQLDRGLPTERYYSDKLYEVKLSWYKIPDRTGTYWARFVFPTPSQKQEQSKISVTMAKVKFLTPAGKWSSDILFCGICNCGICNCGICNCGICNCGVCNCGVCNCGISNCGVCNCVICNFGICNRGICNCGICNCGICNCGMCNCGMCNCAKDSVLRRCYRYAAWRRFSLQRVVE
jgi:hypothetical protein